MPGINQLGGAQTMIQSDTGGREAQQINSAGASNLSGAQEAPDDAVQAAKVISPQQKTDEDGKGPGNGARQFFQLAKKSRRPDPMTGDLISLGTNEGFDLTKLESPKLSLVSMEDEVSKKDLLERALTSVFARPANATLGPKPVH